MKIRRVIEYRMNDSDLQQIQTIARQVVFNYFDPQTETKFYNMLLNERVFTHKQIDDILGMLIKIKEAINNRMENVKNDMEKLRDEYKTNSIIMRPKEHAKKMLENYEWQLIKLDELRDLLIIETEE